MTVQGLFEFAHGVLGAFLIPVLEGAPIDLTDVWDPGRGDPPDWPTSACSSSGHMAVPSTRRSPGRNPTAPEDKRLLTDGDPRPGVEIRLAEDGEILSRGTDLYLGYTDDALTERAFDADGWYHTGDMGVLDEDGYLTITDRKADVIIRGGENISALEFEELLLALPAVAESAVVSVPEARLGEHTAAVLRVKEGHTMPTIDDVRAYFQPAGAARQKWPAELHQLADFPRTASGKVQKYLVRKSLTQSPDFGDQLP